MNPVKAVLNAFKEDVETNFEWTKDPLMQQAFKHYGIFILNATKKYLIIILWLSAFSLAIKWIAPKVYRGHPQYVSSVDLLFGDDNNDSEN